GGHCSTTNYGRTAAAPPSQVAGARTARPAARLVALAGRPAGEGPRSAGASVLRRRPVAQPRGPADEVRGAAERDPRHVRFAAAATVRRHAPQAGGGPEALRPTFTGREETAAGQGHRPRGAEAAANAKQPEWRPAGRIRRTGR